VDISLLKVIPNLMSATVVDFSKGTQHTSDNALNGYFSLHRLLLWALKTYPNLQKEVDGRLKASSRYIVICRKSCVMCLFKWSSIFKVAKTLLL